MSDIYGGTGARHGTGRLPNSPLEPDVAQSTRRGPQVIVTADSYPPAGRRRHWLLLVTCCPFCKCAHAHRGGPGLRDAGCGFGAYVVRADIERWAA